MKRNIIAKLFLCLAASAANLHLAAETQTVDGIEWNYTVSNNNATIYKGYNSPVIPTSTAGAITIPSELGGYPVTSIGGYAFYSCSSLTSITIPDSVTSIGDEAFAQCDALEEVYLPVSFGDTNSIFPQSTTINRYKTNQTVLLDANGGSLEINNIDVIFNAPCGELPVPTRNGYLFDYWMLDGNPVCAADMVSSLENHELVAHWTAIEYVICFHANNGTDEIVQQVFTFDDVVELVANQFSSKTSEFVGWAVSAHGAAVYGDCAIFEDFDLLDNGVIDLYAAWFEYVQVLDLLYSKAQTLTSALYNVDRSLLGAVQIKVAKKDKKGNVKISATVTTLEGKKISAKAVKIPLPQGDDVKTVTLAFKSPIGNMTLELDAEGNIQLYSKTGEFRSASVGGNWTKKNSRVYVDFGDMPQSVQKQLLPDGEPITPKGGKWSFAKAATVKWAKDKKSGQYALVVNIDKGKTNLSAMKLSYAPKTGVFKGSFKVYAIENNKLKKYTAKVTGLVVNFKGTGNAVIPKPISKNCKVVVE